MKKLVHLLLFLAVLLAPAGIYAAGQKKAKTEATKASTKAKRKAAAPAWKPSLKGSRASQLRQNQMADREGLSRITNRKALNRMKRSKRLVRILPTPVLVVDGRLPLERAYTRPWTLAFLRDLAKANSRKFPGTRIRVNSAVRTVEGQRALARRNGNAATATGPTASSHLTGATVDLARIGLTNKQDAWLGQYLLNLEKRGLVEVTREERQRVYHVMVSKRYLKARAATKKTPGRKKAKPRQTVKPKAKTYKTAPASKQGRSFILLPGLTYPRSSPVSYYF